MKLKWYDKTMLAILCILLAAVLLMYAAQTTCRNDPYGVLCENSLGAWKIVQDILRRILP